MGEKEKGRERGRKREGEKEVQRQKISKVCERERNKIK